MFPSQGPQNRPSGAPVILGQGPVSRERHQSVNSTYPLSPLPLDSENRGLPDDLFVVRPSNQQHSEPQTGQPRFTMLPRPVPATTLPTIAMYESQRRPCHSTIQTLSVVTGHIWGTLYTTLVRVLIDPLATDRCERALMVLEVATEN
jgi:hypothetical protein